MWRCTAPSEYIPRVKCLSSKGIFFLWFPLISDEFYRSSPLSLVLPKLNAHILQNEGTVFTLKNTKLDKYSNAWNKRDISNHILFYITITRSITLCIICRSDCFWYSILVVVVTHYIQYDTFSMTYGKRKTCYRQENESVTKTPVFLT